MDRSKVYVVVFNNSNVGGLAGRVAAKASQIGWQVVGSDNWYGTIPASTVYYPKRLEKAGKLLALDLGIQRTAPAVDPMRLDRLTVILTGPTRLTLRGSVHANVMGFGHGVHRGGGRAAVRRARPGRR